MSMLEFPVGVPLSVTWQKLPGGGTGQIPEQEAKSPEIVRGPQVLESKQLQSTTRTRLGRDGS
jgi:hypothetical protein